MFHIIFTLLAILLIIQVELHAISALALTSGCIFAAWVNRQHPNLVLLCLIILLSTLIERWVFQYIPVTGSPQVWVNNRIYLTHFAFDVITLLCVVYRGAIFRWCYTKAKQSCEHIYLIRADMAMVVVFGLFLIVDLSAAVENLLRNLEHLGFSEESAKPLWELNWIFYHYSQMKHLLMGLQFLVLWSMLTPKSRQKSTSFSKLSV